MRGKRSLQKGSCGNLERGERKKRVLEGATKKRKRQKSSFRKTRERMKVSKGKSRKEASAGSADFTNFYRRVLVQIIPFRWIGDPSGRGSRQCLGAKKLAFWCI